MAVEHHFYKILACGLSDKGLVRSRNEDFWAQLPKKGFFALADGMGGHKAGHIAARRALEELCKTFSDSLDQLEEIPSLAEANRLLSESIEQANQHVYQLGRNNVSLRGMGSTLCCVYLHQEALLYGHVGDSRIYLFRDKKLYLMTRDHSLLHELMDQGELQEKDAPDFLYKNVITKAMGSPGRIEPSLAHLQLQHGDLIMMCSDGLTDLLTANEMAALLSSKGPSLESRAIALIDAAKAHGGYDNITVVLLQLLEEGTTSCP